VSVSGCGSSDDTPTTAPVTQISHPTPMNLYAVDETADNPARLFVLVTAVGAQSVRMPLAFDTGSAGITLNALAIFPSSIVTSAGFIFDGGEIALTYNGITITQLNGSRTYGGAGGRSEIGNLGFATVTFGDAAGEFTTQIMPVFLYYAIQSNTDPPVPLSAQTQDGWFGVNDAPNSIALGGPTANAPECSESVPGSCWVASVLKYLQYGPGIDAGFVLNPLHVQRCDITTAGDCAASAALSVGLDSSSGSGFTLTNLPCPPVGYSGPPEINGYRVCQEYIPGTKVSIMGSPNETLTTPVIFDTGTPNFVLNIPSGSPVPSSVTSFELTTPSGFGYSATAGADLYGVRVQPASATTAGSVIGLGYFETNSLLINFATGIQGWK
jgi:hypothetical protein